MQRVRCVYSMDSGVKNETLLIVTEMNVAKTSESSESEKRDGNHDIKEDNNGVLNATDNNANQIEELIAECDLSENNEVCGKRKGKGRGRRMTNVTFLPSDCKLCGEKFASDKALGYHIRDVHVVGKNNPENVKAPEIGKKSRHRYVRHGKGNWKVANPKRPYACPTCGKRFMYESSLTHHQIIKHNEKVPIEGTEETYSNSLLPKLYSHTFQCDQCGKILMSKQSLITHLVSFHGTDHEKPFQCDVCGQRYVSISSLVSHRRREHTGDKPYVCEHCGKAFTMSNRLKCHLRVHSDEKYYKCQQCSKEFKSCSAFRAHKDTHAGVMRHTCKYCGRKFLFQGNMIKHIRRRHPNGEKIDLTANNHEESAEESLPPSTPVTLPAPTPELHSPQIHFNIAKEASTTMNNVPPQSHHSDVTQRTPPHQPQHQRQHQQQQQSQQQPQPQQQQPTQGIVSVGHLVQPEIQFQVLPMPLANQDMFNGLNYHPTHQPHHLHQSPQVQNLRSDALAAGGCRYCEQHYTDVRQHLMDFHRIPVQKLELAIQDLVFY